jgi:hypothetical protein
MQTKTRLSMPRNRATYTHDVHLPRLHHRQPAWDALNRAEYYIWRALRCRDIGLGVKDTAKREGLKAKARYYLKLSRDHK